MRNSDPTPTETIDNKVGTKTNTGTKAGQKRHHLELH